jgi:hypothetical protein
MGAVVSGFMCGDQLQITSMKKSLTFEPMNWRYRPQQVARPDWPQDQRFMVPRHCFAVTAVGRDKVPKQCVLLVACQEGDCTAANAQLHMDDSEAAAAYASRFNKQMITGMGHVLDIADQGEAAPVLKVCAPVTCQVLASSSPDVLARGMVCLLIPYPHAELQKYVFLGQEEFEEVPQTYFHYCAFASAGQEFVCDIQGTEAGNGEIHILDPVVLRTEKTQVQQYITQQWATQAGKTVLQSSPGPRIVPSDEMFDRMHPKCGQLCQSFDPMRKGAKGKKGLCGINVTCMN